MAYTAGRLRQRRHRRGHTDHRGRARLIAVRIAADTCLLINRGLLEHRLGREDLAIVTLPQAYRASAARSGAHGDAHHGRRRAVAGDAQHGRLQPGPRPQPGEARLGQRAWVARWRCRSRASCAARS